MMIPGIIVGQTVWGHLEQNVNIGKRQCEYMMKSRQKATKRLFLIVMTKLVDQVK